MCVFGILNLVVSYNILIHANTATFKAKIEIYAKILRLRFSHKAHINKVI